MRPTLQMVRRSPRRLEKTVYARMGSLGGQEVAVGFPRGKTAAYPETGESVAQVAAWQVYGTKTIPRRDFMAVALPGIIRKTRPLLRRALQEDSDQKRTALLNAAGATAANEIKMAIREGEYEPLSEITIAKREEEGRPSTKPLIDTGHLITSATWVVRPAGGE